MQQAIKTYWHRHWGIILAIIICIGFMLIAATNLQQTIWFDEAYSDMLSRYSFAEIFSLTAVDVHPPLYYWLLKIWGFIFGHTDFALRFMSVFFGAIGLFFLYRVLKKGFTEKAALFGMLLVAISPMVIRYGEEMRMYMVGFAIVMIATELLLIAIQTGQKKLWIWYGILLALGMWTHYFIATVWLSQFIYIIWAGRTGKIGPKKSPKKWLKNVLYAYAFALIFYLPWLIIFIIQSIGVQSGFWIPDVNVASIGQTISEALFYENAASVQGWGVALTLIIIGAIIAVIIHKKAGSQEGRGILCIGLGAIGILFLLSMPPMQSVFVSRYFIYGWVIILGAVGAGLIDWLPKTNRIQTLSTAVLAFALVTGSIIGTINVHVRGNLQTDVKTFVSSVDEASGGHTPLVVDWGDAGFLYWNVAFYEKTDRPVYFIDDPANYQWGSHEVISRGERGRISDWTQWQTEHDEFFYLCDSECVTMPDGEIKLTITQDKLSGYWITR